MSDACRIRLARTARDSDLIGIALDGVRKEPPSEATVQALSAIPADITTSPTVLLIESETRS